MKSPHHCPAASESKARLRWRCGPAGACGAASLGTGPSFSQRGVCVVTFSACAPASISLVTSNGLAAERTCKWSCAVSLRTNQPSAAISVASTTAVNRGTMASLGFNGGECRSQQRTGQCRRSSRFACVSQPERRLQVAGTNQLLTSPSHTARRRRRCWRLSRRLCGRGCGSGVLVFRRAGGCARRRGGSYRGSCCRRRWR